MLDGVCNSKSDVYSYGIVMWEVLSGGLRPYTNIANNREVEELVIQGQILERPQGKNS